MKKIVLKNKESAIAKDFYANWEFVNDKNICPTGLDITGVSTLKWRAKKPQQPAFLKKFDFMSISKEPENTQKTYWDIFKVYSKKINAWMAMQEHEITRLENDKTVSVYLLLKKDVPALFKNLTSNKKGANI